MRSLALLAAFFLTILVGSAAWAQPSPNTSLIEAIGQGGSCGGDVGLVCPYSDYHEVWVHVIIRDMYGTPLPGRHVFCDVYYTDGDTDMCDSEHNQVAETNIVGEAEFHFHNAGGYGHVEWYAECEGVQIISNPVEIKSPDIDGNRIVNLVDFGIFASTYFSSDTRCDYDCSGLVNLVDFGAFTQHYQHECPAY